MASLTRLLVLCPVISLVSAVLQPPTNLKLVSENFQHILTWDDPNNKLHVYYKVDCQEDTRPVVSSKSCSNITSRRCDLTKDFTDVVSSYTATVHSFTDDELSVGVTTNVFNPLTHTLLGPALVDVVPCDYCIEVTIEPPISHLWSEKEQRNISMQHDEVYPQLWYKIYMRHTAEGEHVIEIYNTSNATIIPELLPNTNYCVSVEVNAYLNVEPPIRSTEKCVVTGPNKASQTSIIAPVVCGSLLFIGLLLCLFALDRAGYIGMRMKFFPKVLKSLPRSESRYRENNECSPPTYIVPVEIVSQKLKAEESQENEDEYKEGNYTNRKKLLDSDTSGGDSSGPVLSSLESSGQMTGSSGEERISIEHPIGLGIIRGSADSFSPIPASDLEVSSDPPPFDNSGVFNINLNSICRGDAIDSRTGLKNGGSLKEDPEGEPDVDSGQAELSINGDMSLCTSNVLVDLEPTAIEYGSDVYEEDFSDNDNCGSGDHVVSGYMRR